MKEQTKIFYVIDKDKKRKSIMTPKPCPHPSVILTNPRNKEFVLYCRFWKRILLAI